MFPDQIFGPTATWNQWSDASAPPCGNISVLVSRLICRWMLVDTNTTQLLHIHTQYLPGNNVVDDRAECLIYDDGVNINIITQKLQKQAIFSEFCWVMSVISWWPTKLIQTGPGGAACQPALRSAVRATHSPAHTLGCVVIQNSYWIPRYFYISYI